MNNLRGVKIIYQESKATQPSYLYFLQKDANNFDIIVTSESGVKRRLNSSMDLSNYYTKTEVNTLINSIDLSNYYTKNETYPRTEVDALFTQTYNYIDGSFVDYNNTIQVKFLNYYTKVEINSQLLNYYTKTEVNTNLSTKLDKGTYTGTAQSLKNEIDSKQKLLSSFDESILLEGDGNIEGNVSLFEEYFKQQECELNFTPIQIVDVYKDGIKLLSSEYEIILPKKIKIKEYVDENIQIEYTHLKS